LDLIPALPLRARGIARHRRGLGPRVEGLLARLGVADRGLPPAAVPTEAEQPRIDEIGAIVRRIEAFRRTRQLAEHEIGGEAPLLPLGDIGAPRRPLDAFDFATDAEGRIVWAEAPMAPAVVRL